jgi:hypothetical protein
MSPLISEQFWTVTYSPAILEFVLEFHRVTEQCKVNSELISHGPTLGAKCHWVRKICSLTGTRTLNPQNTVSRLYRLSYPAAYTISPLIREQFWTMTSVRKLISDETLSGAHMLL